MSKDDQKFKTRPAPEPAGPAIQEIKMDIFGRKVANGIELFHASGEALTQAPDSDSPVIYPVDSSVSWHHEHPKGIVISAEDAEKNSIAVE